MRLSNYGMSLVLVAQYIECTIGSPIFGLPVICLFAVVACPVTSCPNFALHACWFIFGCPVIGALRMMCLSGRFLIVCRDICRLMIFDLLSQEVNPVY